MWLLVTAGLMLATPFLLAWYFRAAKRRMQYADVAWDHAEKHARVLLEDRHLDPQAGDLVEVALGLAGRRRLTMLALRQFSLNAKPNGGPSPWGTINREQTEQMVRFLLAAILYDSYRTPFAGALLRHRIMWLVKTATDKTVPVDKEQAAPLAKVAGRLCPSH